MRDKNLRIADLIMPNLNPDSTGVKSDIPAGATPISQSDLTPAELAELGASIPAGATPIDPVAELSAPELAELQVGNLFDPIAWADSNQHKAFEPTTLQKLSEAHDIVTSRGLGGFVVGDIGAVQSAKEGKPIEAVGKVVKPVAETVFNIAKWFGSTLAEQPMNAGMAGVNALFGGDPGTTNELLKQAAKGEAENVAGVESALLTFADTGKKLLRPRSLEEIRNEKARIAAGEPAVTDETKKQKFLSDLGMFQQKQKVGTGQGEFAQAVGTSAEDMAKIGVVLDPEVIAERASGDPFSFVAFGKAFQAITPAGRVLATVPGVTQLSATAKALTSRGLTWVAKTGVDLTGKAITKSGQATGLAGKLAPATGTVTGLVKGGPVGALAGLKTGEIAARGFEKTAVVLKNTGTAISDFSKNLATEAGPVEAYPQLARDIIAAAPGALADVAKGAGLDLGFAAAVSETPQDTEGMATFGTTFGALHGAARGARQVIQGQALGARPWGTTEKTKPYGNFAALDAANAKAEQVHPADVVQRVDAIRSFAAKLPGGAEAYLMPDTVAFESFLTDNYTRENGVAPTGDALANIKANAQTRGMFSAEMRDDAGQQRKVIILNEVDAAPHEAAHAIQDVIGESGNQVVDALVKKEYAGQWEEIGADYARRLSPSDARPWREVIVDRTKWTDADIFLARELGAENFDIAFKNKGGDFGRSDTLPEKLARIAARTAVFLGGDPFTGAETQGLRVQPKAGVIEAVKGQAELAKQTPPVMPTAPVAPLVTPKAAPTAPGKPTVAPTAPVAPTSSAVGVSPDAKAAQAWAAGKSDPRLVNIVNTIIANQVKAGPGEAAPVRLKYLSVAGEEGSTRTPRRSEQEAAYAAEALGAMPAETRALVEKTHAHVRFETVKKGAEMQSIGYSLEKLVENAQRAARWMSENPEAAKLSPYAVEGTSFSQEGWKNLVADIQTYTENQQAGGQGSGKTLALPANAEALKISVPAAQVGSLVPMEQAKADFINTLMGFKLPETTKVSRAGGTPGNIVGQEIAKANEQPFVEPRVTAPAIERAGGKEFPGFPGKTIQEVNPLRRQLEAAGFPVNELTEVVERVNLKSLESVTAAPEVAFRPGVTDTIRAGFLPRIPKFSKEEPRGLMSSLTRTMRPPAGVEAKPLSLIGTGAESHEEFIRDRFSAEFAGKEHYVGQINSAYGEGAVERGKAIEARLVEMGKALDSENPRKAVEALAEKIGLPAANADYQYLNELKDRFRWKTGFYKTETAWQGFYRGLADAVLSPVRSAWNEVIAPGLENLQKKALGPIAKQEETEKILSGKKEKVSPGQMEISFGEAANPPLIEPKTPGKYLNSPGESAPKTKRVNLDFVPLKAEDPFAFENINWSEMARRSVDTFGLGGDLEAVIREVADAFTLNPERSFNSFPADRRFAVELLFREATKEINGGGDIGGRDSGFSGIGPEDSGGTPVSFLPAAEKPKWLVKGQKGGLKTQGTFEGADMMEARKKAEAKGYRVSSVQETTPVEFRTQFLPAETEADQVEKLTQQELQGWSAGQKGGYTATAHRVGQEAPNQAFVDSLKVRADRFKKEALDGMQNDNFDAAMTSSTKAQFFREAWEAATGTGSAGERLSKVDPNYKPRFSAESNSPIGQFLPNGEKVEKAAIILHDGKMFTGSFHGAAFRAAQEAGAIPAGESVSSLIPVYVKDEGFVTNKGTYLTRKEAADLAIANQQAKPGTANHMLASRGRLEAHTFQEERSFLPNAEVKDVADKYAKSAGFEPVTFQMKPVSESLGKKLADFYDEAKHSPEDPAVQKSYQALADETLAQYKAMTDAGYTIEPFEGKGEPYKNSAEMAADVQDNKHLFFLQTEGNFSGENNLMLGPSGVKINGAELPVNDVFRAVHDFFGHATEGLQFGPKGEFNAWRVHSEMYSPEAQGALAAETLAQNSFVNFGKHLRDKAGNIPAKGEPGYVALPDRRFAEQKNVVVPADLINEAKSQFSPKANEDPYAKYNEAYDKAVAKRKAGSKSGLTGWILPNNKFVPLSQSYHEQYLAENSADLNKQFGTKFTKQENVEERQQALDKGFVRLRMQGGTLHVESGQAGWTKAARDKVFETVADNIDNIDNIQVSLLDKNGIVKRQGSERLMDYETDAEKLDNLPLISEGRTQFSPAENENLPGMDVGREFNRAAINQMNRAELRKYFPEAIVPRSADEKINSNIVGSPLAKQEGGREAGVEAFANTLADFYNEIADQPEAKAGASWYSDFTPRLKKEFGKDAPMMAELLAATSPQTNPQVNFGYAFDALAGFKAGKYDKQIAKFNEGLTRLEDGSLAKIYDRDVRAGKVNNPPENASDSTYLAHWIEKHDLVPRGSSGKLFGTHSIRVLQVLSRKWLAMNAGPKTSNFVQNLLGTGHEATIDLWADRTMRRIGYSGYADRWRILPENGTGVSDEDFAFSQAAFRAAAGKLKIKPSALQGALWFGEKRLWSDKGWGRLDLGDYRDELKKVSLLRAGVRQREEATRLGKQAGSAEQEGLDLGLTIEPRDVRLKP